jgi:hypothetical protein
MLLSTKYTASGRAASFIFLTLIISAFLIAARPQISYLRGDYLPRPNSRIVSLDECLGSVAATRALKNSGQDNTSLAVFGLLHKSLCLAFLPITCAHDQPSQPAVLGSVAIRSPPAGVFQSSL